jgi:hypothetical protein
MREGACEDQDGAAEVDAVLVRVAEQVTRPLEVT